MKFFIAISSILLVSCKVGSITDSQTSENRVAPKEFKKVSFPASYRFHDKKGKTPYVLLFQKKDQWVAKLVKSATRTSAHPSGGLGINFVGIMFYQTAQSKALDKVNITFIGQTTAYRSGKVVSLDSLYKGEKITLNFASERSLLGNSMKAESSLSFYYDHKADRIILSSGRGTVEAKTLFTSAKDSAEINNIHSRRDDQLLTFVETLKIEE